MWQILIYVLVTDVQSLAPGSLWKMLLQYAYHHQLSKHVFLVNHRHKLSPTTPHRVLLPLLTLSDHLQGICTRTSGMEGRRSQAPGWPSTYELSSLCRSVQAHRCTPQLDSDWCHTVRSLCCNLCDKASLLQQKLTPTHTERKGHWNLNRLENSK